MKVNTITVQFGGITGNNSASVTTIQFPITYQKILYVNVTGALEEGYFTSGNATPIHFVSSGTLVDGSLSISQFKTQNRLSCKWISLGF